MNLTGLRSFILCSDICSQRDCDVNAQCSMQGSKVSCTCKPGYLGDGKLCIPQNPCLDSNGGCPMNSTVCVFRGANKVSRTAKSEVESKALNLCVTPLSACLSVSQSSCECMSGMTPIGGSPKSGCRLVSTCSENTCHPTARCQPELDGRPRSDTQAMSDKFLFSCSFISRTRLPIRNESLFL